MTGNAEVTLWAKSSSKAVGPRPVTNVNSQAINPTAISSDRKSDDAGLFHVSVVSKRLLWVLEDK